MTRKRASRKKEKKIRIELSSAGAFVWAGILFFFFVWIFALGILVGRDLLPEDIETVAKLKDLIKREESPAEIELAEEASEGTELAFYEKLATKKDESREREPVNREPDPSKPRQRPAEKSRPKVIVREAPVTRSPEPEPVEETSVVVEQERVEEKKAPGRADDSMDPRLSPMAVKARYTVQVAALESLDKAEKMTGRLRARGHPAYYYDITVKGTTYYRVRCGRFLSREEAEDYAGSLLKKEGVKGFVSELE